MSVLRKLRFRIVLWLWARLLPILAWERTLTSLLRLAMPGNSAPYRGLPADYIARRVKKATRRPWIMSDRPCLREGVLAMRFLRLAGFKPTLHFAVDKSSVTRDVLSAHCWVVLEERVLLNPPTPTMVEILFYADDRLLQPGRGSSLAIG